MAPRWLADPSALIALESFWDTRDGACFYDRLRLPTALIRFFGRPQVSVAELVGAGLPLADLQDYLVDGDRSEPGNTEWLSPVSLTWPMGFAHSAYVAQQVMTTACLEAAFTKHQFLSKAGSLPDHRLPCVTAATDDVNAFVRLSRAERDEIIETPVSRLDKVWADMKILPKQEKLCDLSRSGVLLGVELVNGISLLPKRKRMGALMSGLRHLLSRQIASACAMHEYLGVL